jgi:hypothetical protein
MRTLKSNKLYSSVSFGSTFTMGNNPGILGYTYFQITGAGSPTLLSQGNYDENVWVQYIVTYVANTATTFTRTIYKNGANVKTDSTPITRTATPSGNVIIGPYTGSIDELRLWSRVVSSTEIGDLSSTFPSSTVSTSNLELYYKFESYSPTDGLAAAYHVVDYSGNSRHGRITGGSPMYEQDMTLCTSTSGANYLVGTGIADMTGVPSGIAMQGYADHHQAGKGLLTRMRARAFITVDLAGGMKRIVYVN